MELAKIEVTRADARKVHCDTLTAGMKGAEVTFSFDASWDGLNRIVTFKTGCAARDVLLAENCCEIPHEVLAETCQHLMVGIYGTNADGTLVIPTVWADLGTVNRGAKPTGDASAKPTPEVWAQILGMIGDLDDLNTDEKETLVAAINEVRECGTTIPAATADTLGGVKAEPATEDDTQPVRIGEDGMLYTVPGGGGGEKWEKIADVTVEMDLTSIQITEDQNGKPFSLKKVFVLIEAHPALQEGSSRTQLGLNFTADHAWAASFARFRGPANENEWGLRQLVVSVAEDGLLIPINVLVSYNDTTMSTQLNGLKDDKSFIDYTTETAGRTYVSTETWIDIIQLGSYTQAVGKGTRLIVYGVRA